MLTGLALADIAVLAAGGAIGGGGVLIVHVVLAAAGYALWLRGRRLDFAAAMLGVFGPAALVMAGWVATRLPPSRRRPVPLPDPAQRGGTGQRGAKLAVARMLDGRVLHAPSDTLHSLVTVMRHGSVAERRRALETVVRSFQPALSPLIALALTDGDQTIRALAAAASARVVQNLAAGRAALEAKGDDAEARTALTALLADHARANVLLSDSQRAHLRDDALALHAPGEDHATRIDALWATGDYAAIDALVATLPDDLPRGDRTGAAVAWWRDAAAA